MIAILKLIFCFCLLQVIDCMIIRKSSAVHIKPSQQHIGRIFGRHAVKARALNVNSGNHDDFDDDHESEKQMPKDDSEYIWLDPETYGHHGRLRSPTDVVLHGHLSADINQNEHLLNVKKFVDTYFNEGANCFLGISKDRLNNCPQLGNDDYIALLQGTIMYGGRSLSPADRYRSLILTMEAARLHHKLSNDRSRAIMQEFGVFDELISALWHFQKQPHVEELHAVNRQFVISTLASLYHFWPDSKHRLDIKATLNLLMYEYTKEVERWPWVFEIVKTAIGSHEIKDILDSVATIFYQLDQERNDDINIVAVEFYLRLREQTGVRLQWISEDGLMNLFWTVPSDSEEQPLLFPVQVTMFDKSKRPLKFPVPVLMSMLAGITDDISASPIKLKYHGE